MNYDPRAYPSAQPARWEGPLPTRKATGGPKVVSQLDSWSYIFLFVLAAYGYPLAGTLTSILTPGTQTISFGFRWMVVGLSVLVLLQTFLAQRLRLFPPVIFAFFVFCVARMYYDNFVAFVPQADKVGLYFMGTVLPPALVLGVCYPHYDKRKLPIAIFALSAIVTGLVTLMNEFQLAGAANMTEALGRLFFESLNATQIGYAAVFTMLSSLLIWNKSPFWLRLVILGAVANSVYLLGLAAARGPVVAIVLCCAYLAWVRRSFALLALFATLGVIVGLWLSDGSFLIFDRFTTFGADESSDERVFAMVKSWEAAVENPLFGLSYVEPALMAYPHNFTIESAMALGILGLLMIFYIQVRLLILSDWLGTTGDRMLGMLVVSILVGANISGSIWQSADFWMVAVVTFAAAAERTYLAAQRGLNG